MGHRWAAVSSSCSHKAYIGLQGHCLMVSGFRSVMTIFKVQDRELVICFDVFFSSCATVQASEV